MTEETTYFTGLDLGQATEFTALAVLERTIGPSPAQSGRDVKRYGVRHLERDMPELAKELRSTVASYDRDSLVAALRSAVRIYRSLREKAPSNLVRRSEAEAAAEGTLNAL